MSSISPSTITAVAVATPQPVPGVFQSNGSEIVTVAVIYPLPALAIVNTLMTVETKAKKGSH